MRPIQEAAAPGVYSKTSLRICRFVDPIACLEPGTEAL